MTPLDFLITSRVLCKVTKHFCNAYQPIGSRSLARQLGEDCGNVNRALKRLYSAGILKRESSGNQLLYEPVDGYVMDSLRELSRKPYKENHR